MNLHLVAGALVFQQFGSLYGVIVCAGTTGVDAQVHKVLYTSVYIFGIDIHPFQLVMAAVVGTLLDWRIIS